MFFFFWLFQLFKKLYNSLFFLGRQLRKSFFQICHMYGESFIHYRFAFRRYTDQIRTTILRIVTPADQPHLLKIPDNYSNITAARKNLVDYTLHRLLPSIVEELKYGELGQRQSLLAKQFT